MAEFDPSSDAEWMLETIIDDFAQSLPPPIRARFYAQLTRLVAQRRDDEERLAGGSGFEPNEPRHVH
jgi:hypothetical protein